MSIFRKPEYVSIEGTVTLKVLGYDEPNYGRELMIPEILENGEIINSKFCSKWWNGWDRMSIPLKSFNFCSSNFTNVFLPFEKRLVLYNYCTGEIDEFFINGRLVENIFYSSYLFILSEKDLYVMNLANMNISVFKSGVNEILDKIEIKSDVCILHVRATRLRGSTVDTLHKSNRIIKYTSL